MNPSELELSKGADLILLKAEHIDPHIGGRMKILDYIKSLKETIVN